MPNTSFCAEAAAHAANSDRKTLKFGFEAIEAWATSKEGMESKTEASYGMSIELAPNGKPEEVEADIIVV